MPGNPPDEEPGYLFLVEYEEDAERKRVEYLFNTWEDGGIEGPSGLVRIAHGVDHDEIYEQLVTKVPEEQVSSYRLEPVEPDVSEETVIVDQEIDAPAEAIETFVEYMFSKKKAVLQSAANNEYEVYTKKGRAEVTYRIDGDADDGVTAIRIRVTGYPPAPEFLAEFFGTELTDFAESQS